MISFAVICFSGLSSDKSSEFRLLNATRAKPRQFPFVALILTFYKNVELSCTGTIIDDDLILTAAHCVYPNVYSLVVSGYPHQSDFIPLEPCNKADKKTFYCCSRTDEKTFHCSDVKEWMIHDKYGGKDRPEYDIAVIRLTTPVPQSVYSKSFNCTTFGSGGSKNCTLLGFGKTSDWSNRDYAIMRLYYKTGIRSWKCKYPYDKHKFLCLKGNHACYGDSGGPLICDGLIHGVASHLLGREENVPCSQATGNRYIPLSEVKSFLMKHTPCRFEKSKKSKKSGEEAVSSNIFLVLFLVLNLVTESCS